MTHDTSERELTEEGMPTEEVFVVWLAPPHFQNIRPVTAALAGYVAEHHSALRLNEMDPAHSVVRVEGIPTIEAATEFMKKASAEVNRELAKQAIQAVFEVTIITVPGRGRWSDQ